MINVRITMLSVRTKKTKHFDSQQLNATLLQQCPCFVSERFYVSLVVLLYLFHGWTGHLHCKSFASEIINRAVNALIF